jgi:hypothetical protein
MRNEVRIGLIAVAMVLAIGGRGCVTAPPPTAESLVAGASKPVTQSSLTSGDALAPTESTKTAPSTGAPPDGGVPPDGGESVPQTPEERRAALDEQLNDSLGAFDARLHKEQQKTAEERDARQATVAATTTATEGSGSSRGADGADTHKQNARGESRSSRAGDLKSEKTAGSNGSASGNGAPATVIPDGNDDDIVARRIRKAAEQETDPELKDKLWKEYVEYKKNTQVR